MELRWEYIVVDVVRLSYQTQVRKIREAQRDVADKLFQARVAGAEGDGLHELENSFEELGDLAKKYSVQSQVKDAKKDAEESIDDKFLRFIHATGIKVTTEKAPE